MKAMREVTLLWSQYYPLLFFPLLFDYLHFFSLLWNKLCPCADTFFGKVSSIWIGGYLSFILLISQMKKMCYVAFYILGSGTLSRILQFTKQTVGHELDGSNDCWLYLLRELVAGDLLCLLVLQFGDWNGQQRHLGTHVLGVSYSWLRSRRLSIFNHCLLGSLLSLCFGYFIDGVIPLPKL